MDDDRFKGISDDFNNKGNIDQSVIRMCHAVLDDIVRPAIRRASEKIKISNVIYNDCDAEPNIQVGEHEDHPELRFRCSGRTTFELLIIPTFDGKSTPSDVPSVSAVSVELIEDHIERFLRRALKLPQKPRGQ